MKGWVDPGTESVDVLGIQVVGYAFDDAVSKLISIAVEGPRSRVHFANVHNVVEGRHDPAVARAFLTADAVLADGMPILWLARRRGAASAERVSGPDVLLALCDQGRYAGLRHFFLGGRPGVPQDLAATLGLRYPGLQVVGASSPPFGPLTDVQGQAIIDEVNAAKPDVLWIGLGAPKQDLWAAANRERLIANLILPVGAAFDFYSGRVPRAPEWMQHLGLEWLFRLLVDPRRLLGRYIRTNVEFFWLVGGAAIRRKLGARDG